jgi:hypothetical protein
MGGWRWLLMWTGVYAAVVGAHWRRVCQLAVDIGCRCGFAWCIRGSRTRGAHWILTVQLAVGIGCRCGFACIRGSRGAHWVLTWHVHSAGGGGRGMFIQLVVVGTLMNSHLAGSPTSWVSLCYFLCNP